ncbi:MAG: hypothetical protein UZ07_CHB004000549 [Chlorobi bacterium OLB7]|nr:MAG: hypothetical protein UZ07_CHB004000549 [Chlorobi bacterium OLB7]
MSLSRRIVSVIPQLVWWVGAGVIVAAGLLLFGTFWGDSTIYLPYARSIAHGDFFSYNPGEFSSGSTSPLWAALLSIPYLLGADVWGAKLLSLLCCLAAFAVLVRLVRAVVGGVSAAAIAALYAVEMLTFFGVMMYESGLIVLLVSLSLLCSLRIAETLRRGGDPGLRGWLVLAAVWGAIPPNPPRFHRVGGAAGRRVVVVCRGAFAPRVGAAGFGWGDCCNSCRLLLRLFLSDRWGVLG